MVRHKDLPLSIKVDMLRKGEEDSDLMRNYYHGNVFCFSSSTFQIRIYFGFICLTHNVVLIVQESKCAL